MGKVINVPLTIADGVRRGVVDVRNGAPLGETILGNGVRTGLVIGAGVIPWVGPWAANKYLPDGPVMGHGIIEGLSDPEKQQAALMSGS
jgi:hypothetical protein